MVKVPLALGAYPVTPLGSLAKSIITLSEVAAPVQVAVSGAEADAPNFVPEAIAVVPSVMVPLQIVCVRLTVLPVAADGMAAVCESVPAVRVLVFDTVRVCEVVPPATENPVLFAVSVKPFTLVAVATPKVGVVKDGETRGAHPVQAAKSPAAVSRIPLSTNVEVVLDTVTATRWFVAALPRIV